MRGRVVLMAAWERAQASATQHAAGTVEAGGLVRQASGQKRCLLIMERDQLGLLDVVAVARPQLLLRLLHLLTRHQPVSVHSPKLIVWWREYVRTSQLRRFNEDVESALCLAIFEPGRAAQRLWNQLRHDQVWLLILALRISLWLHQG